MLNRKRGSQDTPLENVQNGAGSLKRTTGRDGGRLVVRQDSEKQKSYDSHACITAHVTHSLPILHDTETLTVVLAAPGGISTPGFATHQGFKGPRSGTALAPCRGDTRLSRYRTRTTSRPARASTPSECIDRLYE